MNHLPTTNKCPPEASISPTYARARGAKSPWIETYLDELGQHAQKTKAAKAAGISLRAVQLRRVADSGFAAEESAAMEVAKDLIDDEIHRRALEGVDEPVYQGGKLVGHVKRFSDMLLLRLAERTETGSWRQRVTVEQTNGAACATRAERKARLEKARTIIAQNRANELARPLYTPPKSE